jgi:23S rRNA (cytidine1920-2'-O)/16S rRNA (cytidine1409-2'-O)-methyltransferase
MKNPKLRLDALLVGRGFFATQAQAQAAILAGQVKVDGRPDAKSGTPLPADIRVEVATDPNPFVSRGGLKLAAALDRFPVAACGRVCLDVGASTGGFTDCLLSRGAARVYAVDVGTAQLHAKLRHDPRVDSIEQFHAKDLRPGLFDPSPDLAVVDVSFTSLLKVLPHVLPCLARPFDIVALVKPQFELEPKLAPRGVVRRPEHRALALEQVRAGLLRLPVREAGAMECPVHGPKGNVESFLHLVAA